jgi:hypothetical protein
MMGGLTVRYDMIISGQRGGGITQKLHRDYTEITQKEERLREKREMSQINIHKNLPTRRASTERRKTKKYLFNNFIWNDLPQG